MGLAQDPLAVGEGALVQRDGLRQPPGVLVGGGEVVAGGQGVGVGLAQDPLAVGYEWLAKSARPGSGCRPVRSGSSAPSRAGPIVRRVSCAVRVAKVASSVLTQCDDLLN